MSDATTDPTPAPLADIDPAKLEAWRAKPLAELDTSPSILHVLGVEEVTTLGGVLDAFDGHHGNPDANPFRLAESQAKTLRIDLTLTMDAVGLPPDALCPWLMPALGEADTPVIVEGETAPPPADPTDLDAWDAETARLVAEREGKVGALESAWEDLHAEASLAKKAFEAERDKMRAFIRERRDQRGRPYPKPEKTLFDGVGEADPSAPSEDRLYELSQLYPLDFAHWQEFGLTAKDVEKLNEGVTKHHGTIPLRTLGDVARYTKPSGDGYERRLVDIKGFGPGAFERWEAANLAFWAAWPNGKAVRFAAEIGFDLGTPPEKADASVPGAGSGDGGEGGDGEAAAGEGAPAAEQPPERLRRNEKTGELETAGEDEKPKRKRKKAA